MKTYIYQTFEDNGMYCLTEATFIEEISRLHHRHWAVYPCQMNEFGQIVQISQTAICDSEDANEIVCHLKNGGYYRMVEVQEESEESNDNIWADFGVDFEPRQFDVIAMELR